MISVKIYKNKLLKLFLSLLMCLILIFATIQPTFRVNAVAVLDDAVFFVAATVLLWFGVTVATDADGQQAVADFFWSCAEGVQNRIKTAASNISNLYMFYYTWSSEAWKQIADDVQKYFGNLGGAAVPGMGQGAINPTGDKLGLTDDTKFTMYFADTDSDLYKFPSGSLYIDRRMTFDELATYVDNDSFAVNGNTDNFIAVLRNSDGLSFVKIMPWSYGDNFCYRTMSFEHPDDFNNGYINIYGSYFKFSPPFLQEVFGPGGQDSYITYNGCFYDYKEDSGVWRFYCPSTGTYYPGLQAYSRTDLSLAFLHSLGFVVPNNLDAPDYFADKTNPFEVNKDVFNGKLDDVADMDADSTISTVLPNSMDKLNEMEANPSLVTDLTQEGLYNADIPAINSSPALWTTKFPFCLPWDLYDLFTGFSCDEAVPVFDFLLMPKNAFGLNLDDDFYVHIDLSDFDFVVKMFRFFVGASFVVLLILISRKLIGGE